MKMETGATPVLLPAHASSLATDTAPTAIHVDPLQGLGQAKMRPDESRTRFFRTHFWN